VDVELAERPVDLSDDRLLLVREELGVRLGTVAQEAEQPARGAVDEHALDVLVRENLFGRRAPVERHLEQAGGPRLLVQLRIDHRPTFRSERDQPDVASRRDAVREALVVRAGQPPAAVARLDRELGRHRSIGAEQPVGVLAFAR
jgi:hypothetical protein